MTRAFSFSWRLNLRSTNMSLSFLRPFIPKGRIQSPGRHRLTVKGQGRSSLVSPTDVLTSFTSSDTETENLIPLNEYVPGPSMVSPPALAGPATGDTAISRAEVTARYSPAMNLLPLTEPPLFRTEARLATTEESPEVRQSQTGRPPPKPNGHIHQQWIEPGRTAPCPRSTLSGTTD